MALLHWAEGARGGDREAVREPVDQRRLLKPADPGSTKWHCKYRVGEIHHC